MKMLVKILCVLFILSCSKSSFDETTGGGGSGNQNKHTYKVLEYGNGLPVNGASVSIKVCTKYITWTGCDESAYIYTTSGAEGMFSYYTNYDVIGMTADHPLYWRGYNQYPGNINLIPEAWARVHLKKVNNYSAQSMMTVAKFTIPPVYHLYSLYFTVTADTIVRIRMYGAKEDNIYWKVSHNGETLAEGYTPKMIINKSDTANVEIRF